MSPVVASAIGLAVIAQVALIAWLARRYRTIPSKIPYGTAAGQYFLYGPRALVWLSPFALLALVAWCGVVIARAPVIVRAQPLLAIPFVVIVLATPLVGVAIRAKIDAARRGAAQ